MPVSIKLHLKSHCIETAAKKELKRMMDAYFGIEDKSAVKLEKRIELLQKFIESSDFRVLRASDKRFSGDIEAVVNISWGQSKNISLDIEGAD